VPHRGTLCMSHSYKLRIDIVFLSSPRQDNHWAYKHTHTHARSPGLAVCVIISLRQQVSGVGSICDRTQRYFAVVKCAIVCVMSSLSVSLLLCVSYPLPMYQTALYCACIQLTGKVNVRDPDIPACYQDREVTECSNL